jgi:hypothetical protein
MIVVEVSERVEGGRENTIFFSVNSVHIHNIYTRILIQHEFEKKEKKKDTRRLDLYLRSTDVDLYS